ncbi:MAG TPA: site-specific DNA-methyltransferase [Propionibacteriaceae bacterium]|nr:site-specific DNA-methyltransferase [Propionibacteriaceae bacterium]
MLLAPSLNRVYAGEAPRLAAAELAVTAGVEVEPVVIAGVDYLRFDAEVDQEVLRTVAEQSARLGLYEETSGLLRPIELPSVDLLDEDLVTIPKYPGKTNEQLTRLLLNVTLSQVVAGPGTRTVLDPLCGRGTTLLQAWRLGHDAAGVEGDAKAVEALAAYLKTYLRRKRLKHSAEMTPVRREGKSLGKRFDAEATVDGRTVSMGVFTGDTRQSAKLWGKRRFDAIVTDAPYGVVHGSTSDVRGGGRDRSATGLLADAIPVWAGQLRIGGAIGLSWNTLGTPREKVAGLLAGAGLVVRDEGPWRRFAHRVDSSVHRDVIVAVREV